MSTCELCVVGNKARHAALSSNAGPWDCREREKVHIFEAATYGTVRRWANPAAREVDVDRVSAALVHPEIGVLGCGGQYPQPHSQVGLILSAMRLSRSWEEGPWHAS